MNCDAVAKATQVDGVYSADPKKDPNATRYDRLTYAEVLAKDLKVMDGAAIALARDNALPVIVFSIEEPGNVLKALRGEEVEKETEVPTILVTPDNVNDIEATLQDTVFPVEGGAEATPAA